MSDTPPVPLLRVVMVGSDVEHYPHPSPDMKHGTALCGYRGTGVRDVVGPSRSRRLCRKCAVKGRQAFGW